MHSNIKKIGNSWFIRLPPELIREMPTRDGDEVFIDKQGKMMRILLKPKQENISSEAKKLIEMTNNYSMGNYKFKRDDAYE
ncbi:MAG: hypothetical protein CVT89_01745 [Candidatus Altiarchaeales archaeon HGW-Altiarchaeales-2]|nr:MAG: hypothetical protein CVT89_01745 [Candidatus Altiarchaeales archaeon HGW-Altiarchaeales-2]